jgi:RimJ/RimL family protein N-acetyltransferase
VKWWREMLDLAGLEAKYGPGIDGTEPIHVFVIEYLQQPIGWIQWYRWSDYPDHARKLDAGPQSAGIDLAIGEANMIGVGLGPQTIRTFLDQFVFSDPAVQTVMTDPEEANVRSLRAFTKAGFSFVKAVQLEGEAFRRHVIQLSRCSLSA